MRLTYVLLPTTVTFLISSGVASAAESSNDKTYHHRAPTSYRKAHPQTLNDDTILSQKTIETNDVNASEERMFSINSIIKPLRALDLSESELHKQWIEEEYDRADVIRQYGDEIWSGRHSEQFLKFLVELNRQQDSTIPEFSEMKEHEVWLYAGLDPNEVLEKILNKQSLDEALEHPAVAEFLWYLVEYKKLQSGNQDLAKASEMNMADVLLHAGLTPTQVLHNYFGVSEPGQLKEGYLIEYNVFLSEYNKKHRDTET